MTFSRVFWCLSLACTLTLSGCQTADKQAEHPHAAASPAAQASGAGMTIGLPGTSVYNLVGSWQDQDGQKVTLASLRGRPQVVALIYGSCKGACPKIIHEILSLEGLLKVAHPEGVGFLLVTMDPEVDSPERLSGLAQEYNLGPDWRLLRGTTDQVRELSAVLGVKYRKISQTDFAHSNTITILDAAGTIVHQKQELGTGVESSVKAVDDLLAEPSPCCAP